MKQIIFSALAIVGMFAFISCERHSWEDSSEGAKDGTKRLYPQKEKGHDAHAEHAAHDAKGQTHKKGEEEEHAEGAGH